MVRKGLISLCSTTAIFICLFDLSREQGTQHCALLNKADNKDPSTYVDCKRFNKVTNSKPGETIEEGYRTNSVENFCVVIKDKEKAYGGPGGLLSPAGLEDENFKILRHLAENGAWSHQPTDNLPFNMYGDASDRFWDKHYPKQKSPNPYFIEVSRIAIKGDVLHGWLHFRVFMNRSESLGHGQDDRNTNLHASKETHDNALGRISAMLMMVKDQNGWPIGDFSQDIPCHRTCSKYPDETYYGDRTNALPCAYTPPGANSHPGMFVFDAHPGFYEEDELTTDRPGKVTTTLPTEPPLEDDNSTEATTPTTGAPTTPTGQPSGPTIVTREPKMYPVPEKSRRPGVREVHATWSFTQNSCNFVSKIYIQTLILEDVRHKLNVSLSGDRGKEERLYGWSAQYNILKPTRKSLGAPDYVDLAYLKERELRVAEVDCHVPMFDAQGTKMYPEGFEKGQVPQHSLEIKVDEIQVPTVQEYMFALKGGMSDPDLREYYGQHGSPLTCNGLASTAPSEDPKHKGPLPTASEFVKSHVGIQCPCPSLPTEEPEENRTAAPERIHGRLIHASHMAIAYMLLTPIACFVARYYKETFVTVFCFQEYWWYMWHVSILIVACVFNFGAVVSIVRIRNSGGNSGDNNLLAHKVLGYMSIFVFYMEIFTGFFRVADPQKRMRQIFMHWLIGMMNNACAVGSMFAMAWFKESGMSCQVVYSVIFWLIFVIVCYIIMEIHMMRVDKKLKLVPKRTYLPPPVVRLFDRDAPGRDFRMAMLAVFIIGLVLIQIVVSSYIWVSSGETCSESWLRAHESAKEIDEGEEAIGGQDEEDEGENETI